MSMDPKEMEIRKNDCRI